MIAFHCSRVIKFTTLLDFAQAEGFSDYLDPWGHVTLVLPHLKLESAQALGRLLYCGDTGRVPKHVLDNIKSIIRFEYGGVYNPNLPTGLTQKGDLNPHFLSKQSKKDTEFQRMLREKDSEVRRMFQNKTLTPDLKSPQVTSRANSEVKGSPVVDMVDSIMFRNQTSESKENRGRVHQNVRFDKQPEIRNVVQGVKRKLEININQEVAMVESPVQRQTMNSQENIVDVRDWLVDVESRTRYGGHFILPFLKDAHSWRLLYQSPAFEVGLLLHRS